MDDREADIKEISLSFDEVLELKKTMGDCCKRIMSGNVTEGEAKILPQMIRMYVDLFMS